MKPAELAAITEMAMGARGIDHSFQVTSVGGFGKDLHGTSECKCGRIISYRKDSCAACAGVTDHPTARRMQRAMARMARWAVIDALIEAQQ